MILHHRFSNWTRQRQLTSMPTPTPEFTSPNSQDPGEQEEAASRFGVRLYKNRGEEEGHDLRAGWAQTVL